MKSYEITDFKWWEEYKPFIEYMVKKSDKFSLVYFKYSQEEQWWSEVEETYNILKPFIISERNTNKWPGTITLNENNHIYNMVIYNSAPGSEQGLLNAMCLYAWDYPILPMDLCFYKDGYAWYVSCVHERWNRLITDDDCIIRELRNMGVVLNQSDDIDESELFVLK